MRTRAWLAILCLLFLAPTAVADQHEGEPCDEGQNETQEPCVPEESESEEPNEQPEAEDPAGEGGEDESEDEDDFEDDAEGFEDRQSHIRFDKQEPGFVVPASRPLHHEFLELVEFVDEDGDGAFDAGEPVVARHDLARPPDAVAGNTTRRVTYDLDPGRLHLDVRSVGDATKFDIVIEGYSFASPDTRLALGSAIRVDDGVRFGHVNGAPAILAGGTGQVPYLSWVETVQVDGRSAPVGWSVLASLSADGGNAVVYWAYPQGASITHDPLLGVTFVQVQRLLDAPAFLVAVAASLVFLGLGVLRRRL
jgi:hypothetical protein